MRRVLPLSAVIALVLSLAACTVPTATQPVAPSTTAETVLDVVGLTESVSLSMADLQAMAISEGMAGTKSSTGKITLPATWTGVALADLVALVDGFGPETALSVEAKDGYAMTLSYEQVTEGDFITYDPGTGDELQSFEGTLTVIVAYERDGAALDPEEEGPLRLAIISADGNQVTDGHWSVKWVRRITVKPAAAEWVLQLEGAVSESMDRATFESGAAPGCHGATWADEGGQVWTGMPLWRLVGRVDDEIVHEGPAYNDELAKVGYTIDIVAADGYTLTVDNSRFDRNDQMIVAYLVDGNPLPDKYFPLRLVGDGLEKSEMIGAIASIVVHVPEPAVAEAALTVSGMVDTPVTLALADLDAMEQVTITAKHPKKDETSDYTGVRLNAVLDLAAPQADATALVLTASDGYATIADLAAVRACTDCLVVSDPEDGLRLIMPGMDSSLWVKGLVQIQAVAGGAAAGPEEQATVAATEEVAAPVEVMGDLTVIGLVANPVGFTREELVAAATTEITATHPKKGEMQFVGILLSDLLDQVQPDERATTLVATASDGYAVEIALSDVLACPNNLLAIDAEGVASTVMPEMESAFWVKDVVSIELK